MFACPHCVLRDWKALRATLVHTMCLFIDIWRNHEVHFGMNNDVPIVWFRNLMWQLLKPFRCFLSWLLSRSIHGKTRNHRVPHDGACVLFSGTKCFQNTYMAPISACKWNKSQSRNQPCTRYFQYGPRVSIHELSWFVPFGQSTVLRGRQNKPIIRVKRPFHSSGRTR